MSTEDEDIIIKINTFDSYKRVRKTWKINPVERVVQSKKKYNRAKSKKDWRRQIDDDECDE